MSITARQLSKSGTKGPAISKLIQDQLQVIDAQLQKSPRTWGRNCCRVDLPTTFHLPGLTKDQAQRIIYVSIIQSLEERGFTLKLKLSEKDTHLYIEWVSEISPEEVDSMNAVLKRVIVNEKELRDQYSEKKKKGKGPSKPSYSPSYSPSSPAYKPAYNA